MKARNSTWRTVFGFAALVSGVVLLMVGLRLGNDPTLEAPLRTVASVTMIPAGVVGLVTSFRMLRSTSSKHAGSADLPDNEQTERG